MPPTKNPAENCAQRAHWACAARLACRASLPLTSAGGVCSAALALGRLALAVVLGAGLGVFAEAFEGCFLCRRRGL